MKANLELLDKNLRDAANAYVDALCEKFEWDASYGWWVADDVTGVYCYAEDYSLTLSNIVAMVTHDIAFDVFRAWYDYTLFCAEFHIGRVPSLTAWAQGCPRLSADEQQHLRDLRDELDRLVNDYNDNEKF